MNVALRKMPRLTVPDFVEMIRPYPDEQRWELLDGVPSLMAPQTERHQEIVADVMDRIRPLARRQGCRALPGLGLLSDDVDDFAPIPDIVVRCGQRLDGGYARDPVVVAEVLSPSTMNKDRGRKIDFYRSLSTLRTILIVYQDETRVEAWQRGATDWIRFVHRDRTGVVELPELDGTLKLADIYEDVAID